MAQGQLENTHSFDYILTYFHHEPTRSTTRLVFYLSASSLHPPSLFFVRRKKAGPLERSLIFYAFLHQIVLNI